MKDTEYCRGIRAQTKPRLGVYTASATPRMKPPPTHVAAEESHIGIHVGHMNSQLERVSRILLLPSVELWPVEIHWKELMN